MERMKSGFFLNSSTPTSHPEILLLIDSSGSWFQLLMTVWDGREQVIGDVAEHLPATRDIGGLWLLVYLSTIQINQNIKTLKDSVIKPSYYKVFIFNGLNLQNNIFYSNISLCKITDNILPHLFALFFS